MKRILTILVFTLTFNFSFGQDRLAAEKLIDEGIELHDKGNYKGAISKYDKALKLDKDNLNALIEKSMSLYYTKKYKETIKICLYILDQKGYSDNLKLVYVNLGNAYDEIKEPEKALETYDKGIKMFPDSYLLYYNKAVTLSGLERKEDALECFQKSVKLNPAHGSSHNGLARLATSIDGRIPALLAFCRFLSLEPRGRRAEDNLAEVLKIMGQNVEKKGNKNITINISSSLLGDTTENGTPNENSFSSIDLILSLDAAFDFDEKNEKKSDVEQFLRKFENIVSSLEEGYDENYGFYWDYYAPYFIQMKRNGMLETFAYVIFLSTDNTEVNKWINDHYSDAQKFMKWSYNYTWE